MLQLLFFLMNSQVNDDVWSCLVAMLEGVTIQDWKVIKKIENQDDDIIKIISPEKMPSRVSRTSGIPTLAEEIKHFILKEKKRFLKDPKFDANSPVPGPHLYFVLIGFSNSDLIFQLLNLDVPLITAISIGDYKIKLNEKNQKNTFWPSVELIKNDKKLKNFIITQLPDEIDMENLKNLLFNIVKDMRNYIHYMSNIKLIKLPKANMNSDLLLKYKKQLRKIPLENTTVEIVLHAILETLQSNLKINKKEKPFLINHKDKISINSFVSDYFLDLKDIHINMYMNMPYARIWNRYKKDENTKLKSHVYKLWRCTDFTFDVFKVLLHQMFLIKMFRVGEKKNYEYEEVPVLTKFFECPEIISLFEYDSDFRTDSVKYEELERFLFLQSLQEAFSFYKVAFFQYSRLTDKIVFWFHNDYEQCPKVTETKVRMKTKMGFSDFYIYGKYDKKIWLENESENIRKIDLNAKRKAIRRAKMFGFSTEKVQFPLPKIEKYETLDVYEVDSFSLDEKTIEFVSIDGPILSIKIENEKTNILYNSINENIIINDIDKPDMTIVGQNIAFHIKINFDGENLSYNVKTCLENGLNVSFENIEGNLCVRQEYLREEFSVAENARVCVENGEIIIFKIQDVLILKPDGTICTVNAGFDERKRKSNEEKSEASGEKIEEKILESHTTLDPYGFLAVYKNSEKIDEKHISRIRVAYLLGRQLYIKREDGTNSFYKEDGKLHVKYVDGTLITTKPTQKEDGDFVVLDNEYIQEHPRYSRVHFKKDSCTITLQETIYLIRKNDFYTINIDDRTIISLQKSFILIKTKNEKTEAYFYPQNVSSDRKLVFTCKDSVNKKFSYFSDKTYNLEQKSVSNEIFGRFFVANRDLSGVEFILNNKDDSDESFQVDFKNKKENEKVRIEVLDEKMYETKSEKMVVPYKYDHKMEILSREDLSAYLPPNYKWFFKLPRKREQNICRSTSASYHGDYGSFKTRKAPVAVLYQKTTVVFTDVFSTYKNGFVKYFNYHKNLLENYKVYSDLHVSKIKIRKEEIKEDVKTNELRRMRKARQNNVIQTI